MANIKARLDRIAKATNAGDEAYYRRLAERQWDERQATVRFLYTATPEHLRERFVDALEPVIVEVLAGHRRFSPSAPWLARAVIGLQYHGWVPDTLPAAWVELALDRKAIDPPAWTGGTVTCEDCGLPHPLLVELAERTDTAYRHPPPAVPACLYCGGRLNDYYAKHGRRHPEDHWLGDHLLRTGWATHDPDDEEPVDEPTGAAGPPEQRGESAPPQPAGGDEEGVQAGQAGQEGDAGGRA